MVEPAAPDWRRLLWRRLRVLAALVLIVVAGGGAVYWFAPAQVLDFNQWREADKAGLATHEADIDGQHWAWYEGGSGPTIVLLHGLGASRHDWVPVAAELTGNFRVLIPDLPGWGDSLPAPGGDAGAASQAARLAAFLGRQAPANVVLVGHSMGGLVAGLYAQAHPESVAALGFVAAAGVGHVSELAREEAVTFTDRAGFAQALAAVFSEPPEIPGRIADVYVARNQAHLEWLRASLAAMRGSERSLLPVLPALDKPVLLVWCSDDRIIERAAVDAFRRELAASPRIDVTNLFGCGHMPMLEKPAATAQAIVRFMLPFHVPAAPPAPVPETVPPS